MSGRFSSQGIEGLNSPEGDNDNSWSFTPGPRLPPVVTSSSEELSSEPESHHGDGAGQQGTTGGTSATSDVKEQPSIGVGVAASSGCASNTFSTERPGSSKVEVASSTALALPTSSTTSSHETASTGVQGIVPTRRRVSDGQLLISFSWSRTSKVEKSNTQLHHGGAGRNENQNNLNGAQQLFTGEEQHTTASRAHLRQSAPGVMTGAPTLCSDSTLSAFGFEPNSDHENDAQQMGDDGLTYNTLLFSSKKSCHERNRDHVMEVPTVEGDWVKRQRKDTRTNRIRKDTRTIRIRKDTRTTRTRPAGRDNRTSRTGRVDRRNSIHGGYGRE
ncbi:unnamed protein product [Amoebophrya sp. A120]|nr:unnamed protein product [Amoebophrya sp. A120]|eukprot:GSA120T00000628001.1